MWRIHNRTPYAAERNWIRDARGMHAWVVAVQASFEIDRTGKLSLIEDQQPPILEPEYFGEPGASSLRLDSDLLAAKPGTDILVEGSAIAPGGRPAATVEVTLRAGPLQKSLLVHGRRVYFEGPVGLSTTRPQPFVEQPIRYEYAFGGADLSSTDPTKQRIDERNPVGRGYPADSNLWSNTPAHVIESSTSSPSSGPAGFGAIDRGWKPRRTLAGTYDAAWLESKSPLLPDDYDARFAHCAPADQQFAKPMVGGERLGVLNMNLEGPIVFELPHIDLAFTTRFGRRHRTHPGHLATVVIRPNERQVSLVWQSSLSVPAPNLEALDETRIEER